jgi:hypothetical protein
MATKPNRNIKVSQATIDKIKQQGMSASLKAASSNNSPEYREALRRMYGDARVAKATASTKPSSSGRYVGSMFVQDKAPTKRASTSYSPAPMSAAAKAKAAAAGAAKQQEQTKLKNYKYQAGQSASKPKPTTTIYNPRTGEKITYPTPKPKPKSKPKPKPQLNYNPRTGEKL